MNNIRSSQTQSLSRIRFLLLFPLMVILIACTDQASRDGGDILVIGDSVMAWNSSADASIPDEIGRVLNRKVVSKAVPGAQFDNSSSFAGAVGFDIQRQLQSGRWKWVVMNGGANDLGADCGCGACGPVVDALIGPDATSGAIPTFIQKVRTSTGADVLWMGYYAGSGQGSFAGCRDDLVEMETRLARFARSQGGVYFADAEEVIVRTNRTLFAADNTHPSAKGSATIGAHLADQIRINDTSPKTGGNR